jgi:hypothetical protein
MVIQHAETCRRDVLYVLKQRRAFGWNVEELLRDRELRKVRGKQKLQVRYFCYCTAVSSFAKSTTTALKEGGDPSPRVDPPPQSV